MAKITSGTSQQTKLHELKLRFLFSDPRDVWVLEFQEGPKELHVHTGDWASDKVTRKSISALSERFGEHLIEHSCTKQSAIALSGGEAEYYVLTRGAASGLMMKQVLDCTARKTRS